MKTRDVTIFADGNACRPALRNRLRRGRFTIVLDGAAEAVKRQGWLPDLLAGDFDSVKPATLRHFQKRGVPLLPTPDQNHTDLEKALAWCVLRDFESLWIAQGLGNRVDHSFTALSLLRRFHAAHHELRLFHDDECVRFVRDEEVRLRGRKGRRIAVLPFPQAKVRSEGLAFELDDRVLKLGVSESVSNQARAASVRLHVQGEALVVEQG